MPQSTNRFRPKKMSQTSGIILFFLNITSWLHRFFFNLFRDGDEFTSCEHQGTFTVVTVVVVLVPGAESSTLGGNAALPPRRSAVALQVQPEVKADTVGGVRSHVSAWTVFMQTTCKVRRCVVTCTVGSHWSR